VQIMSNTKSKVVFNKSAADFIEIIFIESN
jgi:hypothetical protein